MNSSNKIAKALKEDVFTGVPVVSPGRPASSLPTLVLSDASISATKWLALVLMVVDHANKYLLSSSVPWMFDVGRITMPLFAILMGYNLARPGLLASGAFARLSARLTLSGLLATVPFVVLNKLPWGWPLNIMFTLLVPVLFVWLFEQGRDLSKAWAFVLLCWGGALGEYWWPAVGLCLCVWSYRRDPSWGAVVGFFISLLALWFINGNFWALACVPVLFLLRWWPWVLPRAQWFFYAFYPLHLAVFWLIVTLR